jgi:hypothetical protein
MPFQLNGRQNLAVHRFNQYCGTKSILLLHGVGSGKTLTSLTMALNSFDWGEVGTRKKIVVVAPSGIFNNFFKELTEKLNASLNGRIPEENENIKGYKLKYYERPFDLIGFKYSYLETLGAANIKAWFKDAIVIFDEAHRLFRPASSGGRLLDFFNKNNIMQVCKRFICMTGTPFSSRFSDIFDMIRFVQCSDNINCDEDKSCEQCSQFQPGNYTNLPAGFKANTFKMWVINYILIGGISVIANVLPDKLTTELFGAIQTVGIVGALKGLFLGASSDNILQKIRDALHSATLTGGGEDPYSTLELNINEMSELSDDEKKVVALRQYKKLALQYHPDRCKSEDVDFCKRKFQEITNAIEEIRKGGSNLNIFNSILNPGERFLFFEMIFKLLESDEYSRYFLANEVGFKLTEEKIFNKDVYPAMLPLLLLDFKREILPNIDGVNQFLSTLSAGKDSAFLLLNYLPMQYLIEEQPKLLAGGNPAAVAQALLAAAAAGRLPLPTNPGDIVMRGRKELDKGILGIIQTYLTRNSGLGGIWVNYIKNKLFNLNEPFNYSKLAKDSLKYISLIDNQMKAINPNFTGKYNSREKLIPGLTSTTLDHILRAKITELEGGKSFSYPSRDVVMMYNKYTIEQIQLLAEIKLNAISVKPWLKNDTKSINDIRNSALRTVGNYSTDFEKFTAAIVYGRPDRYEIIDHSEARAGEHTRSAIFDCPKFRRVLQHLLLMTTGKMFSFKKNIDDQAHLCKDAVIPEQLQEYDDRKVKYPDSFDKIAYADANYYFLPLVYSCGGKEKWSPGINIFAAFLERLGLKYIVLHPDSPNLEAEKLRAINKIYPLYKNSEFFDSLKDELFNSTADDDVYTVLKNLIEANPIVKENPICVLIHADMTEGIDLKHNPAIFLLEPPSTIVDYEQICGRVLRTYGKPYAERPNKMVYQLVAYNSEDINHLYEEKLKFSKSNEIKQGQELAFFTETGELQFDLQAEIELNEEVNVYRPKNVFDRFLYILRNTNMGGKQILEYVDYFKNFFTMEKGQLAFLKALNEKLFNGQDKINIQIIDIFMGKLDYKLALLEERYKRAIIVYNRITDIQKEFEPLQELANRGAAIRGDLENRQKDDAYREMAHNILGSESPDLDRVWSLQAEDYQIQKFIKEFRDMKFPDLEQIKVCASENAGSEILPWCDPFIKPIEKNKLFTCKLVNRVGSISKPPADRNGASPLVSNIKAFNYNNPDSNAVNALIAKDKRYRSEFNNVEVTYKEPIKWLPSDEELSGATQEEAVGKAAYLSAERRLELANMEMTRLRESLAAAGRQRVSKSQRATIIAGINREIVAHEIKLRAAARNFEEKRGIYEAAKLKLKSLNPENVNAAQGGGAYRKTRRKIRRLRPTKGRLQKKRNTKKRVIKKRMTRKVRG